MGQAASRPAAFIHLTGPPEPTNPSARRSIIQAGVSTLLLLQGSRTVAKPELGAKRHCQSCATKFYDLNKSPILCPKCGTVFQVVALSRAPARVEEEESEVEKEGVETISLDEVEESENAAEAIDVEDDVELDDAAADDDTFLEEEEGEDDDVTGLIDGDIESDDEV
jgi:uncharacterized protein (TIGR02300 family)